MNSNDTTTQTAASHRSAQSQRLTLRDGDCIAFFDTRLSPSRKRNQKFLLSYLEVPPPNITSGTDLLCYAAFGSSARSYMQADDFLLRTQNHPIAPSGSSRSRYEPALKINLPTVE